MTPWHSISNKKECNFENNCPPSSTNKLPKFASSSCSLPCHRVDNKNLLIWMCRTIVFWLLQLPSFSKDITLFFLIKSLYWPNPLSFQSLRFIEFNHSLNLNSFTLRVRVDMGGECLWHNLSFTFNNFSIIPVLWACERTGFF